MVAKIPVIEVLKQSLTMLRENIVAAVFLFAGPALIYGVQMVFLSPPVDPAHPQVNWLGLGISILLVLALIPSLAAWYRRAFPGEASADGLNWRIGRAEGLLLLAMLKMFGWVILAVAVVGAILGGLAYGGAMLAHPSSEEAQVLAVSIIIIGLAIVVVGILPLTLMFPAAALGTVLSRKQAFSLTCGNRWRLLFLLGVFPIGIGLIPGFIAKLPLAPILVAILLAVGTVLAWSFNGALLALCYRHLASPVIAAEDGAGATPPEFG